MPLFTDIGSIFGASPPINTAQLTGINSTVVAGFITQAENEIAAKVSNRYTLPFSNGCPIVATIALRESIFRLSINRGLVHFPPATQGKAPLMVQHEMDMKLLEQIFLGEINLLDNSLAVIAPSLTERGEIYSNNMNYNPTMHEGSVLDMVRDTDKLDDILSAREQRGLP